MPPSASSLVTDLPPPASSKPFRYTPIWVFPSLSTSALALAGDAGHMHIGRGFPVPPKYFSLSFPLTGGLWWPGVVVNVCKCWAPQ